MSSSELAKFAKFMKRRGYDISEDVNKYYTSLNPMQYQDLIISTVSEVTKISIDQIRSKSRKREIVYARSICCKMLKEFTSLPLKSIGLLMGGRDHSTVIHALEAHENIAWQDYEFKLQSEKCRNIINTVYLQRELEMALQKGEGINKEFEGLQNSIN